MTIEVTDELTVKIRYEFKTDDGTAWSVPLRPAAVQANCRRNMAAAFELERFEAIARRLVRRGMPAEDVHRLLEEVSAEIGAEVRDDLAGVATPSVNGAAR